MLSKDWYSLSDTDSDLTSRIYLLKKHDNFLLWRLHNFLSQQLAVKSFKASDFVREKLSQILVLYNSYKIKTGR